MSDEEKRQAFERENGYFPNRANGKANIERYRYVSGLIFERMREFMDENVGQNKYMLEKASIDELYLDLTQYVKEVSDKSSVGSSLSSPSGKVLVVGPEEGWTQDRQVRSCE